MSFKHIKLEVSTYTYFVFLCFCSQRIGDFKVIIVAVQDEGIRISSEELVLLEVLPITKIPQSTFLTGM